MTKPHAVVSVHRSLDTARHAPAPRRHRWSAGSVALAALVLVACGADSGSNGQQGAPSAGDLLCQQVASYAQRCGSSTPCDQALVADCGNLAGFLSEPFLTGAKGCVEGGDSPPACFATAFSALAPTSAQRDFIKAFCSDCPPVAIPGCEQALLGEGDVPEQLAVAKTLILPFGDALLEKVKAECISGLTCLAQFPSCVQSVLAKEAIPSNTIECMTNALLGKSEPPPAGAAPGCQGAGGSSSGGAGGAPSGGAGGTGTGGSGGTGTGGSGGTGSGGAGGAASGGSGGAPSGSCTGHCGSKAPEGCYCDSKCTQNGDCCSDYATACPSGTGGTGSGGTGSGGAGTGGTGSGGTGGGGGVSCTDVHEPNESFASAKALAAIDDCDVPVSSVTGVVAKGDLDFFKFSGKDTLGCGVDPTAQTTAGVKLCMYATCTGASVSCTAGASTGANGYAGCCSSSGLVSLNVNCAGATDDATVYLSVEPKDPVCVGYTVKYHY